MRRGKISLEAARALLAAIVLGVAIAAVILPPRLAEPLLIGFVAALLPGILPLTLLRRR